MATCTINEDDHDDANTPEPTGSAAMKQTLVEVKSVSSHVNSMDEAAEAHLDGNDRALSEI